MAPRDHVQPLRGFPRPVLQVLGGARRRFGYTRWRKTTGPTAMYAQLKELPLDERIKLVEDLWDSIAAEQDALPLTAAQRALLDERLEEFARDGDLGDPAFEVLERLRKRL